MPTDHVEPPTEEPLAVPPDTTTDDVDESLRTELQHVLGCTPDEADEWIDEHGPAAVEERVIAYWTDG